MVKLNERSRTYVFAQAISPLNDTDYTVENVRELLVSESGGHRLTTEDGGMIYIPYKWIAIEIDSEKGWEA